jgi:hypothetical protein
MNQRLAPVDQRHRHEKNGALLRRAGSGTPSSISNHHDYRQSLVDEHYFSPARTPYKSNAILCARDER